MITKEEFDTRQGQDGVILDWTAFDRSSEYRKLFQRFRAGELKGPDRSPSLGSRSAFARRILEDTYLLFVTANASGDEPS